ncbi:EF hand [Cribrihabitans marinus]|uniref:EF hand n=1 Tax=Cribrihabitans marinus TaxID=1227549 RepID=A0A1H6TRX4_9RHOB|nr:EF-hand domain-containing protein [Cribrihabitans marinus]SEI82809.1 EF hand [Cribrihabitans marinus]
MRYAGFMTGIVLAAAALTATEALAHGPGGGQRMSFEQLDADSDGQISQAELQAQRTERFRAADTDGDGKLSAAEIEAHAQSRASERAGQMLERFDANKDGMLDQSELPQPRRAGRFFDRVDTDGDGAISKAEYAEARDRMRRHGGRRDHGRQRAD